MEKEYITKNREAYNIFAKQHNERLNVKSEEKLKDEYWYNLAKEELIAKNKINTILEIGPGSGRILRIFESISNCRTIAVELSSEMIKYAKVESPNTVFIEDNILNVKFSKESFDVIFMGAVIHNFPVDDAKELLKLVNYWLKPNGKILLYTTIHKTSAEGYYEKEDYSGNIIRYRKKFTEQELKNIVESSSFKIIKKIINNEDNRNKKWLTYILEKVKKNDKIS